MRVKKEYAAARKVEKLCIAANVSTIAVPSFVAAQSTIFFLSPPWIFVALRINQARSSTIFIIPFHPWSLIIAAINTTTL